jgi:hypothetical protein
VVVVVGAIVIVDVAAVVVFAAIHQHKKIM